MEKLYLHKTLKQSSNLLQIESGYWRRAKPEAQNQFLFNYCNYFVIFFRKNPQSPLAPMHTQRFHGKVTAICKGPKFGFEWDSFFAAYPMFIITYSFDETEKFFVMRQKIDLDPLLINPNNLIYFAAINHLIVSCNHGGLGHYILNSIDMNTPIQFVRAIKTLGGVLSIHLIDQKKEIIDYQASSFRFGRFEGDYMFRIYDAALNEIRAINLNGLTQDLGHVYLSLPFLSGTIFICENGPFLFDSDEYPLSRVTTLNFESIFNQIEVEGSEVIDSTVIDWCPIGSDMICLLSETSQLYTVEVKDWTCHKFRDDEFPPSFRNKKIRRIFQLQGGWIFLLCDLHSYIIEVYSDQNLQPPPPMQQMGGQAPPKPNSHAKCFPFEGGLNIKHFLIPKLLSCLLPGLVTYSENMIALLRNGATDKLSQKASEMVLPSNFQATPSGMFTAHDCLVVTFKNGTKFFRFHSQQGKLRIYPIWFNDNSSFDQEETIGFGFIPVGKNVFYIQVLLHYILIINFNNNSPLRYTYNKSDITCRLFAYNEEGFIIFHDGMSATRYILSSSATTEPFFDEYLFSIQMDNAQVTCVALPTYAVKIFTKRQMSVMSSSSQQMNSDTIPQTTFLIGIFGKPQCFVRIYSFVNCDPVDYAEHVMPCRVLQASYISLTRIILALENGSIVAIRYDPKTKQIHVTNTFQLGEGIPTLSLFDYPGYYPPYVIAANTRTVKIYQKDDIINIASYASMPFSFAQKAAAPFYFSITGKTFYIHKVPQDQQFSSNIIDQHNSPIVSVDPLPDPRAFIVTTKTQVSQISTEEPNSSQQDPVLHKLQQGSSFICACTSYEKKDQKYRSYFFAIIKNNPNQIQPDIQQQQMQQMNQGMGGIPIPPQQQMPQENPTKISPYSLKLIDLDKCVILNAPLNEVFTHLSSYGHYVTCAKDTTLAIFRPVSSIYLECYARNDNVGTSIQAIKFEGSYIFVGDAHFGVLIYHLMDMRLEKVWAQTTHRFVTSIGLYPFSMTYLISSGDRTGNVCLYQAPKPFTSPSPSFNFNVGEPISCTSIYFDPSAHPVLYYSTIAGGIGGFLLIRKDLFPQRKTPDWLKVNLFDLSFIEKRIIALLKELIGVDPYEYKNQISPSSSVIDMDIVEFFSYLNPSRQEKIASELNELHVKEEINIIVTALSIKDLIAQMKLYFIK